MITVTITGDKEIIAGLGALPPMIRNMLLQKMTALTLQLQAKVQTEHLSGPTGAHTLSVRSGALRRSVFQRVFEDASGVYGIVGYGADVPYAAIHEFGGTIHHPGGTAFFIDKSDVMHFVSNASALAAKLPRTKPHDIPMPERAPLRSAFAEMQDQIKQELMATIAAAVGSAK
jgi:phage gpG-like protein